MRIMELGVSGGGFLYYLMMHQETNMSSVSLCIAVLANQKMIPSVCVCVLFICFAVVQLDECFVLNAALVLRTHGAHCHWAGPSPSMCCWFIHGSLMSLVVK